MNTSVIRYLLGYIFKLEGFLLLLPCIVAGIYYEKSGIYFLIVALISIAIGFIFSAKKPRDFTFYLKEGCATTALGWIVYSAVCRFTYQERFQASQMLFLRPSPASPRQERASCLR